MNELQSAVGRFVEGCGKPALSEPGEELIALHSGNLFLDARPAGLFLQAWDDRRNLVRKITGVDSECRSQLVLKTERFGKKPGTLSIVDLQRSDRIAVTRKTARLEFREVFRRFLRRELANCRLVELTTEANLEYSLSPAYPRAFLREGATGWAAIGAPPGCQADDALSFGLIWLDYLRRRERQITIEGLVLFLPEGQEKTTCLRIRCLDFRKARYSVFAYSGDGGTQALDLADYGNIDTHLDPCTEGPLGELPAGIANLPGVETVRLHDGGVSFRVRGLEFARVQERILTWGLETKRAGNASHSREIQALAGEVQRLRSPHARDRQHPIYLRNPEAWLESQVRAHLDQIDAALETSPVYGQVPAFVSGDRGVIDLLAIERSGRLAVLELKASQDIHLPLQGLDYWMRVQWHLGRGEFSTNGYFPGCVITHEAPKLLLIAPALDFHPSNEIVLRFFSPHVEVQRLGVGLEWQQELKLMYRMQNVH